mmetsp:Transcript_45854/g.71846  ORF Transcript_45854/g.71846 Transcript_45854/m.71846 type:complete len:227 (+) Transcript_45854:104-784(+)
MWLFLESSNWCRFDPNGEQTVEKTYQEGKDSCECIFTNGRTGCKTRYVYDLKKMLQINTQTGFKRNIKRVDPRDKGSENFGAAHSGETIRYTGPAPDGGFSPEIFQSITGWTPVNVKQLAADDKCAVCLTEFAEGDSDIPIKFARCKGHYFHRSCVENEHLLKFGFVSCPVCFTNYGIQRGTQPPGTMKIYIDPSISCLGYEFTGSIVIEYSGSQSPQTQSQFSGP